MEREKVEAYLESKRDEMLSDLQTLVRIDSQRGPAQPQAPFGEGAAAALSAAQGMMERYGLSVKNYDNYVVTGDLAPDQPKELDILAHLDVVPVTKDWTVTEPFEPRITDGKIYGRGTADDKGPAIAALYALRAIHDLDIPLKKNVRLILGSDEECGSGDLAHYYAIEQEAPCSFTPDADFPLINIEKGRMEAHLDAVFHDSKTTPVPRIKSLKSGDKANVVPARAVMEIEGIREKPVLAATREVEAETGVTFEISPVEEAQETLRIEAHGLAAHASTPEEGRNALTAMLRLVTRLELTRSEGLQALYALDALFSYEDVNGKSLGIFERDEQSGVTTLCFSMLDYTPEGMTATFDARLPIGCTDWNTRRPVSLLLEQNGIHMADEPIVKPHCVSADSAFVRTLLESYEYYSGKKGEAMSTGGGTYVHDLERGVAFGCMMPGVDNHMHGDDEFMEIDTLMMSAKIFADAVIRLCAE